MGSRARIGVHLAYTELTTVLATIWRRHELERFDTDQSHIEFGLDMIRSMPKQNSKGVRVVIKRQLTKHYSV